MKGKGLENILYKRNWAEVIMKLPDGLRLSVHDAICQFLLSGEDPSDDVLYHSPYLYIKTEIERDKRTYEERKAVITARNKANGIKGGRPKKITQENPVGFSETQITQKKAVKVRVREKEIKDFSHSNECVSIPRIDGQKEMPVANNDSFIDFNRLVAFWNEKMNGKQIPQIIRLSQKRRTMVNARATEYGKNSIRQAIENAANSNFLNGGGNKAWIATFDWVFAPNNFPKVLEGNYENTGPPQCFSRQDRLNDAERIIQKLMDEEKYL